MTIPNLPTDNLYKFGFVFSIIVFIFFIYYHNKKVEYFQKMDLELKFKELDLDLKYSRLTEDFLYVAESFKSNRDSEMGDVLSKKFEELDNSKLKADSTLVLYNEKVGQFNVQKEEFENTQCLYYIAIGVSLFFSIICGLLWYCKSQKFEDRITKLRYLEMKQKLQQ
ncbi:hypothetical protein SAMN05660862_2513 [Sphingobacterium psychroaquaticum]|uniref:Four helix bundle sensory module for signal transduction n=2 Tax=Sphingobacterium psychroaquaticum TaxID=561061 RepID=A0A1X7K370_9SPHI|nr:hypothetical protein SAMN05660862_2513 [Sphingobacterium psychroaquaticum]